MSEKSLINKNMIKSKSIQVEDKVDNNETEPTVSCKPPLPQTSGIKIFKKCQSATFQIDGHTYTIGMSCFSM